MEKTYQRKKILSLILCDLDFFKPFNDTYGHQAGDDCLQKVAATIEKSVGRPGDLVARYGGEEFAVILPNTDIQGAEAIAERIRESVHNLEIEHKTSAVSKYVSLSLGIGTHIPKQRESGDILLTMADKALYQAKENGRNQYLVYDGE